MTDRHILSPAHILLALLLMLCGTVASALPTDHYASSSRLAQGRWMKVRIDTDGLYRIPASTLRSWGFSDISRVRVFGYGGRRISNVLSASEYIDDLPMAPCELTDRGLVFYGVAGGSWENSQSYYHFETNDYSKYGYYYIGETSDDTAAMPTVGTPRTSTDATRTFQSRMHYERELQAVGDAGPLMVGEDFRYTRTRNFAMDFTDAVDGGSARVECSFVANMTSSGTLTVNFDDSRLGVLSIPKKPSDSYTHGVHALGRYTFTSTEGRHSFGLTLSSGGTVVLGNLNYISVTYDRHLRLPAAGWLEFNTQAPTIALDGAADGLRIWDVTSLQAPADIDFALSGTEAQWSMDTRSERAYVAWLPSANLPAPQTVGAVSNQDLHSEDGAEMIIVCPPEYNEAAERLAAFHRTDIDPISVKIVAPQHIYNEFSSGSPDVSGIRKYLKMLYDRGNAGAGDPLRYVILMARTTLDNRGISAAAPSYPVLPAWMPATVSSSLSDNEGFCTDDFVAMLADGSGADMRRDKLAVAVGRIPVTSADEANSIVDKTLQYAAGARKTAWKQRFLFVADDGDSGEHLNQTETMISKFDHADRQQHLVRKVYVDNYELNGSVATMARETMYRYLDEGVVWWNYIGHANETSWTKEGLLTYTDLSSLYLRHWPFIYAATCDFLRFDAELVSGAELLYKERYGGAIGVISAIRPVYITYNKYFSNAIGRALARRDQNGILPAPGDIYLQAKNDIRDSNDAPVADDNRLRFVFIGDPALRLATPSNIVRIDRIKGLSPEGADQIVIGALEKATVEGSVTDPDGNVLSGFNGIILLEIFDAERSFTTLGHGSDGTNDTFEDYGERVYCGSTKVVDGHFSIELAMPAELSQNFRPATMSLFAYATDTNDEAIGLNRDFYVYGYDETAAPDETAPKIESMVLNHSTFRSGDTVNSSPMLIATVSDDTGINVSTAGIGRQMTAIIDGTQTYSDISFYYTPAADGSASGIINYPFDDIKTGAHSLKLKIWDTAGNSTESELEFFVAETMAPKIYDVYSDANPAVDQANFYLSHDQPDAMATVEVSVYNLMGRKLWSRTVTGRSDMFLTVPVTWNLCYASGRRVGRGIYLYRATITTDGQSYQTASRRIAVAAQ